MNGAMVFLMMTMMMTRGEGQEEGRKKYLERWYTGDQINTGIIALLDSFFNFLSVFLIK